MSNLHIPHVARDGHSLRAIHLRLHCVQERRAQDELAPLRALQGAGHG
jgi:hypothetical protein